MKTDEEYGNLLTTNQPIYIYGAGVVARRLMAFCNDLEIQYAGIIVTKKEGNPSVLNDVSVREIDEIRIEDRKDMNVVVALGGYASKWLDQFVDYGFKSICFISSSFQTYLRKRYSNKAYGIISARDGYFITSGYPLLEPGHAMLMDEEKNTSLCRIFHKDAKEVDIDVIERVKKGELEKLFGSLKKLPFSGKRDKSQTTCLSDREIYIVTSHIDKMDPEKEDERYGIPIQVGTVFADITKKCIQDNSGDNISKKNRNYCECTALYWIWKNTNGQKHIGLEHYRRRMGLDSSSFKKIQTDSIDFVTTLPQYTFDNIRVFFSTWLCKTDWRLMKEGILKINPEMERIFEEYEKGHFFIPCNIGFWSREWFDKYCCFAFSVADYIENYYQERNVFREDRYMGYVFENLYSIYIAFYHKEMKLAFVDMDWIADE